MFLEEVQSALQPSSLQMRKVTIGPKRAFNIATVSEIDWLDSGLELDHVVKDFSEACVGDFFAYCMVAPFDVQSTF